MRQKIIMAVLLCSGAIFANERDFYFENDGGFVGLDLGYSMIAWQSEFGKYDKNATPQKSYSNHKKNIFGVSYGLVIGYKQFFNAYIGARYYARFGGNHGAIKRDGFSRIDLIDYSANADFLANVYVDKMLTVGLFVGLGIGGNTIVGKYVRDAKRKLGDIVANDTNLSSRGINPKAKTTHFDFAINTGLRLNIWANHGIELVARVPLLTKSVYNDGLSLVNKKNPNDNNDTTIEETYSTIFNNQVKPNHSIMVRYVFSF